MNKIAKAAIGLMMVNLLAKILGFGRELVLASAYGTSAYSDAYLIALNIPMVIFVGIGQSLATTFIPLYNNINVKEGKKYAVDFMNNVLNIVAIICVIVSIIGVIFTEPIVKVFAVGFEGETFEIAVDFTRVLILGIGFIGLSNLITSYLQIHNNFIIPGFCSIPKNIIIILSIYLSTEYGTSVMIWGTLVGISMELLFQIPFARKNGYKYNRYLNLNDENINKMMRLLMPVFIGIAVNQINTMVDRTLASTLAEGSISALNYANKLNGFVMALFILSIATVIYPRFSILSAEKNKKEFNDTIVTSINSVILLIMPVTIGAIVLSHPIVKMLFERGAFDSRATMMTSIALICYSIGLIGVGLRDILGKVFYSLQDTKTPMINGTMAVILNIILNLILSKLIGHAGLALATSISAIICIVLLFKDLKKKIGYFGEDKILKTFIKSLVSAIIMGFATTYTYEKIISILERGIISDVISVLLSILVGAIIYFILILVFRVEEVTKIIKANKSKC